MGSAVPSASPAELGAAWARGCWQEQVQGLPVPGTDRAPPRALLSLGRAWGAEPGGHRPREAALEQQGGAWAPPSALGLGRLLELAGAAEGKGRASGPSCPHAQRDMVLLLLAALLALAASGDAQKESVLQFPAQMTIQAGHSATLHCNFSTSDSYLNLFWYQQHQSQSPQMLLWVNKYKARVDAGRFTSLMSAENSQVFLQVQDAELQDSAAYFCVLSPPWCPERAALHNNVGGALGSSSLPAAACLEL
ncbi:uncharacterized protein LOC128854590 isoform X1 [Cuculus canorus]|uniref:uncharacterized protein LOC128854590 isoform X1 n=1 Tax=Cuculus canorus TaxID=55661 RepID=UPI0023AAD6D3|nr:uncharacterized protein LOC128854590 isoform X1 [Cuculus canorus]